MPNRMLYHGSPKLFRRLKPKAHYLADYRPVVFATPLREIALASLQPWNDDIFEQGVVGEDPPYMMELRPNAFRDVYGGKRGYLYTLAPDTFYHIERLARFEQISDLSPEILDVEVIEDALSALQNSNMQMIYFENAEAFRMNDYRQNPYSQTDPEGRLINTNSGDTSWRHFTEEPDLEFNLSHPDCMRRNPTNLEINFGSTKLPLSGVLQDSDGDWYILHSTAGKSLINESLEYGSSAISHGPGQFILPRMKGLYAVHASDLDRVREIYDGPIYRVNLNSDHIYVFDSTDSVTEAAIGAEDKSVEGFDLRLYYESLLDAIVTTYTASETRGMLGSIEETLLLMMGGGELDDFDRSYYALLDSSPELLETKGEWEGHIRTMLEEGYLPALAGAGAFTEGGYNPKYNDVDMEIEWDACPDEWLRRWEEGRFYEDRTFEDFLRKQGTLPSEVVAYAWSQATHAAGVLYVANELNRFFEGDPLNILVILNEDIIKSSRLVAGEPRRRTESTDPVRIRSQEAVLSYLESLGASNTLRSQIRDLEEATRIGVVPTAGKEVVSAYFDGKDLIAIAWATRASSLNRMESDEASVTFDILIDPDFQGIGLGKQLLCDAISHLIEISKDYVESININVAVVSPILRRYLRTLGFKWVRPYDHLANTVEMQLSLSDTDAILTMCEELKTAEFHILRPS